MMKFGTYLVVEQLRGVGIGKTNLLRNLREGPAGAAMEIS